MFNINELIIFLIVLITGFLLRMLPILKFKWFGTDTFYHLSVGKKIKKIKRLPKKEGLYLVEKGDYEYPPLLHIIISLFPNRVPDRFLQILPSIFDMISVIILYVFVSIFLNSNVALISSILYFFVPMNVYDSFFLTSRNLGNLCSIISIVSFFLGFYNTWFYFLSILFFSFTLLSHKLSAQTVFVIFLVLMIINPLSILVIFFGFILALIITLGRYKEILRDHIEVIVLFAKDMKKFVSIKDIFASNTLLFFLPLLLTLSFSSFNYFLLLWAFVPIILAIFWLFGDAHRHTKLSTFPLSILVAQVLVGWKLWFIIPYLLLTILICVIQMKKNKISYLTDFMEVMTKLKKIRKKPILTIPLNYCHSIIYFTDLLPLASNFSKEGVILANEVNPKLKNIKGIKSLIKKYSIGYIFVDKKLTSIGIKIFKKNFKIIFENKRFCLFST